MQRLIGLALALTLVGAPAASAQSLELDLGRDRGQEGGFDGERGTRGDRIIVRINQHDGLETGALSCRPTVVRRMNDDGDIVTKRIRKCD